jgi:hypothetical protein
LTKTENKKNSLMQMRQAVLFWGCDCMDGCMLFKAFFTAEAQRTQRQKRAFLFDLSNCLALLTLSSLRLCGKKMP